MGSGKGRSRGQPANSVTDHGTEQGVVLSPTEGSADRLPAIMTNVERGLQILLRIGGITMLSAFFAIFLPVRWMAVTHEWLGSG